MHHGWDLQIKLLVSKDSKPWTYTPYSVLVHTMSKIKVAGMPNADEPGALTTPRRQPELIDLAQLDLAVAQWLTIYRRRRSPH